MPMAWIGAWNYHYPSGGTPNWLGIGQAEYCDLGSCKRDESMSELVLCLCHEITCLVTFAKLLLGRPRNPIGSGVAVGAHRPPNVLLA